MTKLIKEVLLLFFVSILFLISSCTLFSPKRVTPTRTFHTNNYLITSHFSIMIPDNWVFSHIKPIYNGQIGMRFCFHDPEQRYHGIVELEETDKDLEIDTLKRYYLNRIKDKLKNIKTVKTTIDRREAIIFKGIALNNSQTIILLYPLFSNIILVEINYPFHNSSKTAVITDSIVRSLSFKRNIEEERKISSGLHFISPKGNWKWYSDVKRGFIVQGKINNKNGFIGIWKTNYSGLNELKQIEQFNIKIFNAFFYINNQKVYAKGVGNTNNKQAVELFYLLKYRNNSYIIYINYNNSGNELNPVQAYLSPDIVYFFSNCLLLERPAEDL